MAITGEFERTKRRGHGSRIPVMTRFALLLVPIALGCGSDSTSTVDAPPSGSVDAKPMAIDAPAGTPDTKPGPDAPPGTPDAAVTEMVTLTLNNFDFWCTVTADGAAAPATKMYAKGTVVHLNGGPVGDSFVWGYWSGTDGGNHDTSMMTTVTMSADKTVLACCPFKPPASQLCQ
jgi:hypothetical protein